MTPPAKLNNPRWDPDLYARFRHERTRPLDDLLARVPASDGAGRPFQRILDVGCGTGVGLARLAKRFPEAQAEGLDASPEMVARARDTAPGMPLHEADLRTWEPSEPYDLILSNAVLHWVDDHGAALERLLSWLTPAGVLAVQVPDNHDAPAPRAVRRLVRTPQWKGRLGDTLRPAHGWLPDCYVAYLGDRGCSVDAWATSYAHVLPDVDAAVDWLAGTTLRPQLDRLVDDPATTERFLADVQGAVDPKLDRVAQGVTFPFRRVFFVATRGRVRPARASTPS